MLLSSISGDDSHVFVGQLILVATSKIAIGNHDLADDDRQGGDTFAANSWDSARCFNVLCVGKKGTCCVCWRIRLCCCLPLRKWNGVAPDPLSRSRGSGDTGGFVCSAFLRSLCSGSTLNMGNCPPSAGNRVWNCVSDGML